MPTGPPRADHDTGILARMIGQSSRGRTGSPQGGGRYGLLLVVLTGTRAGLGAAELWKALVLLMTAVVVVRRLPDDVDGPEDDEDRD
jgi:hypothetical protein